MRKSLIISFSFLLISCYQVERNCTDFKTGTFEFIYTKNGEEKIGKFIRLEDHTVEYYEGKTDTSSVRWINDCEFITKKLHPTSPNEEKAIHMKILTTSEDSYVFEYKYAVKDPNKSQKAVKGVAKKVN